jgi:Arc/MetJ-type ribon-helix-helix transcriptional regulator
VTIRLKPELECLIQKDVERGPYQTVDEFVEHAVELLHEQEEWLSTHRAAIGAKIDEGYASAQRGDLLGADEVRVWMEEKKAAWRARRGLCETSSRRKLAAPESSVLGEGGETPRIVNSLVCTTIVAGAMKTRPS